MRLVQDGVETIMDFVVPTLRQARAYIADGTSNGVELLEEAGLSTTEAEAEAKRIEGAR